MIKRRIDYPPCQHLDPNERDAFGRFYCERRGHYVAPAATVYTGEHRASLFNADKCAPDCWHRRGKTRRAVV